MTLDEKALEAIEEAIADQLIDAEVDYPAGHDAGHRISWDSAKMRAALSRAYLEAVNTEPGQQEAVAWRYRTDEDAGEWEYTNTEPPLGAFGRSRPGWECGPLYTRPAPAHVTEDAKREIEQDIKSRLRTAFRRALSELPVIAPPEVRSVLSFVHMRDEFWNEGKRLQMEHGVDAVAPRVEQECGAGAWSFMRAGVLSALDLHETPVRETKPLNLNITKEWFEERAAQEGDHEIGAGRKLTACVNPKPEELAELYRIAHHIPEGWQLVPDGWQLVPKEPLPEIIAAFWRQKNRGTQEIGPFDGDRDFSDYAAYRAMLAAAPTHGGSDVL